MSVFLVLLLFCFSWISNLSLIKIAFLLSADRMWTKPVFTLVSVLPFSFGLETNVITFFSLQSNYKRVRPSCHFTFGKSSSNWNIGLATGSVCLTYHTIAICYSYGRYGRIYSSSGIFPTYNCYFAIVGQKQQHTNPMLWVTAEGLTFCMACGKEKFESVLLMLPKACWGGGGVGGVGGVGLN